MRKFVFVAFVLMLLFPINCLAYDENTQSIAHEAGVDSIKSPYLDNEEINGEKNINIFQKVIDIIGDTLKGSRKNLVKSFGNVLAVVILCCIMHAMKFDDGNMETAVSYISVLSISGICYTIIYDVFIFVIASMETLKTILLSLLPIMASLNAFGGTVTASAFLANGMNLFLSVVAVMCSDVILPLMQIAFGLSITGVIPGGVNLTSATNFVKTTANTLMAFMFTILGFVMYFQTSVAKASDNFFMRSLRFASGNFVPVIGSLLGESYGLAVSSVSVIKGTTGIAGVVLILSAVLPALVMVVIYKLMLLICGIIAKALGCDKESGLIYDLNGILGILIALVIGSGVVALIAMAIFIKTEVDL